MIGFPSAGQPTGLSGLPFLILLDHWGISPSAEGDLGALPPRPLPAFWEKAGSKTLLVLADRFYGFYGCSQFVAAQLVARPSKHDARC